MVHLKSIEECLGQFGVCCGCDLGPFGIHFGVHFRTLFGARCAIYAVKPKCFNDFFKHAFYTVKHGENEQVCEI